MSCFIKNLVGALARWIERRGTSVRATTNFTCFTYILEVSTLKNRLNQNQNSLNNYTKWVNTMRREGKLSRDVSSDKVEEESEEDEEQDEDQEEDFDE